MIATHNGNDLQLKWWQANWPCRLTILLTLLVSMSACARRNAPVTERTAPNTVRYTGQILVTGTEGSVRTSLHIDGRSAIGLQGALSTELRNLSGARVTVQGTPATGAADAVDVVSYEVVEVNGQKPYVGTLVRAGDGYAVQQSNSTIRLQLLPAGLIDRTGAKVWVTGVMANNRLQVQAFGIIRIR
ncbi:MAG: hypothetical protein ACRENP_28410 [Longimicrobiales bacterium]